MMQAIILAAGRSTRMGGAKKQKLLMPFRGMAMVDLVIKTVLSCDFDRTSVVVSRETLDCLLPIEGAHYIVNLDPDRGQASSLHCALAALPNNSSFAVFLGDKPAVTARQIMALRRRFEAFLNAGKNALVPRKDGAPGHPSFYSPTWRERFLHPDANSRIALLRHEDEVEWAEVDGHDNFFLDVDTPEDYRRLLEM